MHWKRTQKSTVSCVLLHNDTTVTGYKNHVIMSGQRESEDDVDIYGDLPNFQCFGDTVKEVSMLRYLT